MSSKLYSQFAQSVSGTGADAWEVHRLASERIEQGEDIVLLTIGEDVSASTPDAIVEEAVSSLRAGRHHYPSVEGITPLRQAIARRHAADTGRSVETANVTVFAGAQNALFALALTILDPGDEVIVIEPYYSTYPATFSSMGCRFVAVQADPADGLMPDPERVRAAMSSSTRMVVVNSPNNPTGAVYEAERLAALVKLCRDRGCWLLSDEVYADFVFDGVHVSAATNTDIEDQIVVVSSVSKSHRMSGWRVGWAITPRSLAQHLSDLNLCMTYGLPPFIQDAARFAIQECAHVPRDMAIDYGDRARRVTERLSAVDNLSFLTPKAGMFVMLDVSQTGHRGTSFAKQLLAEQGVAILPCESFGNNLDYYLRMSLCADRDSLDRACSALEAFVKEY